MLVLADPTTSEHQTEEDRADALLTQWQDDRCALCGARGTSLVQDHDHATGLVRGWLCNGCNTREGVHTGPEAAVFSRYRERHPTSILGLRIRYWDPILGDYAPPVLAALPTDSSPWSDPVTRGIGL